MYGQPDFTKGHWYTIRCRGCGVVGIGARSDIIALLNEIIYSDNDFKLLAYNFTPLYTRQVRLHDDDKYNEWVNVNNGRPFNIIDPKIISSSELTITDMGNYTKDAVDEYISADNQTSVSLEIESSELARKMNEAEKRKNPNTSVSNAEKKGGKKNPEEEEEELNNKENQEK